ncbi:MAG: butyryl-CoA:acetate CoA-transferase [Ruminococcaceae bacterium]|nr:butyryl-CoA:acetate CoA-transferase [Oscillospiraceae bacterium]
MKNSEYKRKLITPQLAASLVKSGDWVDYSSGSNFPALCDAALAERCLELSQVKVRGQLLHGPVQILECDPEGEHFTYSSWHTSAYERKLCDKGRCFYEPMLFRNIFWYYEKFLEVDVAYVAVSPIDEKGNFNFSFGAGVAHASLQRAKTIVVEVNENLPRVIGNGYEHINIKDVDYIVEGSTHPLPNLPSREPTETDKRIAELVIPHICNGATIQLGIGGVPDALGIMIANSELKDLGMHTEYCSDSFLHLYEAGVLSNKKKNIDTGLGVFGVATGTAPLYEWLRDNSNFVSRRMDYVNDPYVISQIDNFISLNSCISVDLFGQVSSESSGLRHISGTGGQVDFLTGAAMSRGGKAFICMHSSHTDKNGIKTSRIVPHFNGDIVTSPRSQAYYIATEYGIANLAGRSSWERAEMLISLSAPEFRDELIKSAEKQNIWRKSNKR